MARIILNLIFLKRRTLSFLIISNFFSILLCNNPLETNTTDMFGLTTLSLNQTTTTAMLTISNSGSYLLLDTFTATPTNNSVSCIKIDTDNVFLYFHRNSITHDTSGGGTNLTALEISSGKSNITIIGGNIFSIDGTGIKIGANCHDISIINLKINECTKVGLDIDTANNINIENIIITNCNGSATDVTEAIALKLNNCNDIKILNSNFTNNKSTNDKDAIGVFLSSCKNCKFIDCESSSNVGGAVNSGGKAFGFKITSTTKACIFKKCEAKNNTTLTANNCYGFFFSYSNANEIQDCICQTNLTAASSGSPNIFGFYMENSLGNVYRNCISKGQNAGESAGNAFGFYTTAGKYNGFLNCTSTGNAGGIGSATIGAGFALRNGESFSIIQDSFAIGNGINAGEAYGIMIGFTGDSGTTSNNIVHNNTILNNIGTTKKYGYRDFSSNSTTVLSKNISSAHGAINPGLDQLTLSNNMNYMFTFTGADHEPQLLVEEINLAQVGSTNVLSSTPFVNLSITD